MSLRYSCAAVGRLARLRVAPLLPPSSSHVLAVALAPAQFNNSHHHHRPQIRLSSNASQFPTLTPPWQFEDLTSHERKAFERWGPNYFAHMTTEHQELALKTATKRAATAVDLEKDFGSDWYAIMKEATVVKDREEREYLLMLHKDAEYRKYDKQGKKQMLQQLMAEYKATKAERLRETMRKVARNRGNF